jgi:F0F1-type ATP synthase membrane subunit a
LAPLVVIELISYIFRPISLGVRLFANLTAGHSLLAIIAGFSSTMIATNTILWSMIATIPCIVILAILGLELAVAFLQAYILLCYYVFILKMLLNFINFYKSIAMVLHLFQIKLKLIVLKKIKIKLFLIKIKN